ncbi:hypothetical protein BJV77DRAFT_1069245 [Russula vinacea]|nr:hypothetical protein BJV77DRAFT_1069245 [Russula vinacea]
MPGTDLGCAVNPDGSLKDAADIDWPFDVDDEVPSVPAAAAGSQCSGRIICPSNRILDPNNAMGLSSKVSKLVDNFDTSEDKDDNHRSSDVDEGQETEDAVDADEEYETLKAMADADHKLEAEAGHMRDPNPDRAIYGKHRLT